MTNPTKSAQPSAAYQPESGTYTITNIIINAGKAISESTVATMVIGGIGALGLKSIVSSHPIITSGTAILAASKFGYDVYNHPTHDYKEVYNSYYTTTSDTSTNVLSSKFAPVAAGVVTSIAYNAAMAHPFYAIGIMVAGTAAKAGYDMNNNGQSLEETLTGYTHTAAETNIQVSGLEAAGFVASEVAYRSSKATYDMLSSVQGPNLPPELSLNDLRIETVKQTNFLSGRIETLHDRIYDLLYSQYNIPTRESSHEDGGVHPTPGLGGNSAGHPTVAPAGGVHPTIALGGNPAEEPAPAPAAPAADGGSGVSAGGDAPEPAAGDGAAADGDGAAAVVTTAGRGKVFWFGATLAVAAATKFAYDLYNDATHNPLKVIAGYQDAIADLYDTAVESTRSYLGYNSTDGDFSNQPAGSNADNVVHIEL